nr:rhabdomeric opsin [Paramacrobiotus areolatus]
MVSVSTMACIAVDRCLAITLRKPRWHLTYSRAGLLIGVIWLYGFILVMPPLCGWSDYMLEGHQTSCTFDFISRRPVNVSYTVWLFVMGLFIPVSVIAVCYVSIVRYILNQRALMRHVRVADPVRNRLVAAGLPAPRRAEVRAAVTCGVIIVLFCLAWLPYTCISLMSAFGAQHLINPFVNALPSLCSKSSVIWNPLVHALMNRKFRAKLLELYGCRSGSPGHMARRAAPRRNESLVVRLTRTARLSSDTSSTRTTSLAGRVPVSPVDRSVGFEQVFFRKHTEPTCDGNWHHRDERLLNNQEIIIHTIPEASNENECSSNGLTKKPARPFTQIVEVETHDGLAGCSV